MKRIIVCCIVLFVGMAGESVVPVIDPGSRGIDWNAVKAKTENHEWAARIVQKLKREVHEVKELYEHPPLGTTGWLHEYYCDDDARRLRFDPKKPNEHPCPHCKRVYNGSPYDDCWRSMVHSSIATTAKKSAALFRITGETDYLDYSKSVLLWYARHFDEFESHGNHAGKGWIREQSLDEATQLVRLAQTYWDICPFLTQKERESIATRFLIPDAKFIHAQTGTIHNIHSWHNSAVGLVGLAVGDDELANAAIDGKFGLWKQIEKGIKEDGFWFEGSISYHYYTIGSMQDLVIAARAKHYPMQGMDKYKRMYTAPIRFSFPNGEFPSNNDGWPGQNLMDKGPVYEIACHLWKDANIRNALSSMSAKESRSSLQALLYGPEALPAQTPPSLKSHLFKDSGIAFLRKDETSVYLKFGPYGGGHDHLDRLNMILFAKERILMPDLGTSGYGISLNKWYRSSAAHNLLVVDSKRQARCGGYLISYENDRVTAGVKDGYPGVDIRREMSLLENGANDRVWAESDTSHRYDLFYHIRGSVKQCSIPLQPAEPFKNANGYNSLRQIRKGTCTGALSIEWTLRDVPGALSIDSNSAEPFEVYVGLCPDNPADLDLSFLMLRSEGKRAEWKSTIRVKEDSIK